MKLLSVQLARSIWLGPTSDFNPRGTSLYRILFPFLIDTYKFRKYPSPTESSDLSKGVRFEDGEFIIGENIPITANLLIYNDGMIADTSSSTTHSDSFLEDIYNRFSEIFRMPRYESIIRKKVYVSQLFISTDKSLELINPKLKEISKYLSETVEQGNMVFQVGGISFWPDQVNKVNPVPFSFERTTNVPFSENRYYSAAPLPTDKHLELLDKVENILG
jgi:hypothetical protein